MEVLNMWFIGWGLVIKDCNWVIFVIMKELERRCLNVGVEVGYWLCCVVVCRVVVY